MHIVCINIPTQRNIKKKKNDVKDEWDLNMTLGDERIRQLVARGEERREASGAPLLLCAVVLGKLLSIFVCILRRP